jgi:hypothetical protein
MASFDDFTEPTPTNTYIIQHTLREIDSEVLVTAMVGLSDVHREMFYRNVSVRVRQMCEEEIQARIGDVSAQRVEDAKALILDVIHQQKERVDPNEMRESVSIPEIKLGTHEEMIVSFRALATYVRRCGFLPLQEIEDEIEDPMMRKGIKFLIDGTDPLFMHALLEKYKSTLLRDTETRYDMILDGIDTLATRYLPQAVEDKLRTHIPS